MWAMRRQRAAVLIARGDACAPRSEAEIRADLAALLRDSITRLDRMIEADGPAQRRRA